MSTHRAKRRSREERADILRGIQRGDDGKPTKGAVEKAARKVGVSNGTIYGWISRDGWPDDTPVEAAERLASERLDLQAPRTSGQGRAAEHAPRAARRPPEDLQALASHRLSPRQEMVARLAARDVPHTRIAAAAGVHRSTVARWVSTPGPIVDLIGELRAISRPQIRATAAHIALQSMDATAAGYDVAQDIRRELTEAEERLRQFNEACPPNTEDGEPRFYDPDELGKLTALEERVDALRGQYLTAVKALEPSRKTTLQSMGILDGGVGDGLEKGAELTPREKRIAAIEAELAAMGVEE